MTKEERNEIVDILNWCLEMDAKQEKRCGNCNSFLNGAMCFEIDSNGQSVLVSRDFLGCSKWSVKSVEKKQ